MGPAGAELGWNDPNTRWEEIHFPPCVLSLPFSAPLPGDILQLSTSCLHLAPSEQLLLVSLGGPSRKKVLGASLPVLKTALGLAV